MMTVLGHEVPPPDARDRNRAKMRRCLVVYDGLAPWRRDSRLSSHMASPEGSIMRTRVAASTSGGGRVSQ